MLKYLFLLLSFSVFLTLSVNAQNTKSTATPKPEKPPGNIRLLEGYVHIKQRGIDTSVGEISKPNGLKIGYDNGFLAGRYAGGACGRGECLWYKRQKVNGRDVWIGLTKDGRILATFPEVYANFFAQTKSPEDVADFLLMILTYGNDEAAGLDQRETAPQNVSQNPANSGRLFPVSENEKWGYVDEQGKMIIKPQFESASAFVNGRAAVVVIDNKGDKNQYGFIDRTGKMIVAAKYDEVNDFSEGLALVSKDYRWGYIDASGKEVIPLQFIEAFDFSEGFAAVYVQSEQEGKDSLWGYIDKTGKLVIPPKFYKAYSFHEGVAKIIEGKFGEANLQGFIDTTGNFLIKPQYSLSSEFSDGLIPVEIGGRNRKDGERSYTHISGKWGYVDKTGKIIIEAKFDNADEFSEGLASVTINGKYGYIDKRGEIVIKPQFTYSSNGYRCAYFSEGLACFERDGKIGFIDKTGKIVIEPQFNYAEKFKDGFASVSFPPSESSTRDGGGMGVIDKTGKIIWKPVR